MQIEPLPNGLKVTIRSAQADGSVKQAVYEDFLDGKDHPFADPDADTISYRRVSPRKIECLMKRSEKPIGHCRLQLTSDGNELTFESEAMLRDGKPFKLVRIYRRQ